MKKAGSKTFKKTLDIKQKVSTIQKVTKHTDNVPVVSKRRYLNRRSAFVLIQIVAIIAFSILTFFVHRYPHNGIDLSITRGIQSFHPVWFRTLMQWITYIGNNYNATIVAVVIAAFFFFKKRIKEGVMLLVSTGGGSIISLTIKNLVHRPRPDPKLIHQVGSFLHNDSFPSGHVLFYMSLFGFLLYLTYTLPPENKYRLFFITLFIILLLLIAPSRIFLGAHWFSDTLGSYLIGFLWLSVVTYIYNRWVKKGAEI